MTIHKTYLFLIISMVLSLATTTSNAQAGVVSLTLHAPDYDRWMYPFNSSPGDREIASTFSSIGGGYETFDDRDAQILLGFISQEAVPSGLGIHQYDVIDASIRITINNEGNVYDPSIDPWDSYLVEGGIEDVDVGRPMELYGAAFRSDFDGWSFGETGPFPFGASRRERNAYPITIFPGNEFVDVSNSVLDSFTPTPFAVGTTNEVIVGDVIPAQTVLTFDIDVSDPDIQCYMRQAFHDGLISLVLTSLHEAQQPGIRNRGVLIQPNFHMKESWAVFFGLVDAAQFTFTVVLTEPITTPEDLDGNGVVGVSDILIVLSDWGVCSCCRSDLNADGEVNIADLLSIIAAWSS